MSDLRPHARTQIGGILTNASEALAATIDGSVVLPGTTEYDRARSVWNAMIDRRPELIVQCRSPADVAAAIGYGRAHDLEIGVKCGGHAVAGHAVPDGGLMIDLTAMNDVVVDPTARRARIGGGALLRGLDQATQEHRLAVTAGNVSHTGVGGLTLGGGMGWLARQYGLSCDNVESFQLVTAGGDFVTANSTRNPELYWALRGGGGNFGVVTEFEFRLHPVAGTALVEERWFGIEEALPAMRNWRALCEVAPRQATLTAWVGTIDGRPRVNLGFVWVGEASAATALRHEFDALGTPLAAQTRELSYLALQTADDTGAGPGSRRYWKGHYLSSLPDAALEAFLLRGTDDGTGELLPAASLQSHGGAIADVGDDETAFSHRDALVEFTASVRWDDPAEDDARIAAARRYAATIEPYASGAYVNALSDEGVDGVRRAFPEHKLARLRTVKSEWDPDNIFRLNHNITPAV